MILKMKLRYDIACIVHNYQEKSMSIVRELWGRVGNLRSDLPWGTNFVRSMLREMSE